MIRLFESNDVSAIQALLSSNQWPFHSELALNVESYKENYFNTDANRSLVYINPENKLKGYIRFFDIENSDMDSPLFDIRVDESTRGQGIGT